MPFTKHQCQRCTFCRQELVFYNSEVTTSSCRACSNLLEVRDGEHIKLRSELEATVEKLKSRMYFLRPTRPLRIESADGSLKADVRIEVRGSTHKDLFAHKFVLSSRSAVFRKMFDVKMMEADTGIVCIDDASADVVDAVIQFCYDAEIEFTDAVTAKELLEVAHKYGIGLLQSTCEENLIAKLSCENIPDMMRVARKYKLTGLEKAASQFFKNHFDDVIAGVVAEVF